MHPKISFLLALAASFVCVVCLLGMGFVASQMLRSLFQNHPMAVLGSLLVLFASAHPAVTDPFMKSFQQRHRQRQIPPRPS